MEIARSGHLPLLAFDSLRGEQFWGRAVRHASHDSNRVWGVCVLGPNSHPPIAFPLPLPSTHPKSKYAAFEFLNSSPLFDNVPLTSYN